ncbi:MAG: DUF1232 domain-containing protein [Acidobacteria bacterium]|nr:MAG: DUF1232 domain-containing protein [Acidobacteriota bacterium]
MNKIEKKQPAKIHLKSRIKNLLLFLPNLLLLLGRLIKDPRVPKPEKALLLAAIVYAIAPLDFLPDLIPFVGQVDDIYLISLTVLRLINNTEEEIVRQHWSGSGDIVALANAIANLAPIILPKRVSKVITSKVELAKSDEIINSLARGKNRIIKEIPQ